MAYLKLPLRVFNSPLIKFANFQDGTSINLIRLNKPYRNGDTYAIYETTTNPFCSNGLFKTLEAAEQNFAANVAKNSKLTPLLENRIIEHNY